MTRTPYRWLPAFILAVLYGLGLWALLALTSAGAERANSAHWGLLIGALVATALLAIAVPGVPPGRGRLSWLLAAGSALAVTVGTFVGGPWAGGPWAVAFASSGLLWGALLARAGEFPQGAAARLVLIFDLLVTVTAAVVVVMCLAHVAGGLPAVAASRQALMTTSEVLGVLTLLAMILMLQRPLPSVLRAPRGLFMTGIALVISGDMALGSAGATGSGVAPFFSILAPTGLLLYGVAAWWEATLLRDEGVRRMQSTDPFPSLVGMLIPVLMVAVAAALTISGEVSGIGGQGPGIGSLGLLLALALTRQVVVFISQRRLYGELQRLYAEAARNAASDPLTALPNHRYFMGRLTRELHRSQRYGRPLALIFADLDHFKQVNDVYGHAVGDEALLAVSDSLQACIRETDVAARYGGEEFVVLLPETSLEQGRQLAERLRRAIEVTTFDLPSGGHKQLTISCGVAAYPETSDSLEVLLADADTAMYRAKELGRNRVAIARSRRQNVLYRS